MTKKLLPLIIVLAAAWTIIFFFRHSSPKTGWRTYDGKLARLNLPVGWKTDEYGNGRVQRLDLETKTLDKEFLIFSLAEYFPSSGKTDVEKFVQKSIAGSPQPHPIVVKQTTFGHLPAQEFTTYMPKPFVHNYDPAGVDVINASYTEERNIVFARENGLICEIVYNIPEAGTDDYDAIFRKIVASIQLK